MDHYPSRRRAFAAIATITLLAAATGIVAVWPLAATAARAQSRALSDQGARSQGNPAVTYYHLATWLDPSNQTAQLGLAQALLASQQPQAALEHLSKVPGSLTAQELRLKILLELGDTAGARAAAGALTSSRDAKQLELACLAYVTIGQSADCQAIMPLLTDSEALRRVTRAQSGKLTLAAELAATGLLNSSYTILRDQPTSFVRNLLMARIAYNRSTRQSLAEAKGLLEQAVVLDPSTIEGRQLLALTYKATSDQAAANEQNRLVTKLISGRP